MTGALAELTPVAVQFIPEPLITWVDLRGVPFIEPFFRDTLAGAGDRTRALGGLDELRALDDRPTLPPALFIFHVSRCGSTLLSQMLAAVASNVVVSEPPALNDILSARRPAAEEAELLRLVLRALGRNRGGPGRRLIVKFSSWNVLAAATVHRLFPDTPLVWLQRAPAQVLASLAERPAGWSAWRETGAPALELFGLPPEQARAMTPARFRAHAVEAMLRAVHEAKLPFHVVDHADLPGALEALARQAALPLGTGALERMRDRARFDAKAADRPFVPRDRSVALPPEERRFVEQRLAPLYRALARQEP